MSATYKDLRYAQEMLSRMVEELNSKNSELHEEVAQLKEQLDSDEHELSMAADREVHAARREAKLRELVEDMLDCIDTQIAFERVPARWMQDEFAGRARELGIEVGA